MLGVAWTVSWLELGSFCPQTVTLRLSAETWSPPLLSSEAELTPSALRLRDPLSSEAEHQHRMHPAVFLSPAHVTPDLRRILGHNLRGWRISSEIL